MKLKSVVIAVAGLSLAAVVFAQTSQSSSSQSSRSGNAQTSTSSSSSSHASSSKSASANASSSKSAGGGSRSSNSGRGSGSGSGSDSDSSFSAKPTHAIMYTVNSSVASSSDAKQKAFQQHAKYLGEQQDKGKVILFGPWRDLPGSMAIVAALSDDDANQIAKNDPAVRSGALTFEVRAWLVMAGVSNESRK